MNKRCPQCDAGNVVRFSTCTLPGATKPGYLACGSCRYEWTWHLAEGQKPLVSCSRDKRAIAGG